MTTDGSESGFVLPLVLVALTVLYMTASVGYTLSVLETRMSEAHAASVDAFYLADGAMRDRLASSGDTAGTRTYRFASGSAVVRVSSLLEAPGGERLARVTATGRVPMRYAGSSERRVETVALVAADENGLATRVAVPGMWREIVDW